MAVKYFCDVCKKEIDWKSRIHIMGSKTELNTLCDQCWSLAEKSLLTSPANLSCT